MKQEETIMEDELDCPLGSACTSGPDGGIWKTKKINVNIALQLLEQHVRCVHQTVNVAPLDTPLKPEKLVRPVLKVRDGAIEEESWEFFTHQWASYKVQANLSASAKSHLESCLGDEVTIILFGRLGQTEWDKLDEKGLLREVKDMFVKKRNRMVNRLKLQGLVQGDDQPVQQFIATLKQVARTCQYYVKCTSASCRATIDYSQEMVLDQLVRGLNDNEIQRKVLSCKEEDFNLDTVEKVIIAEESSRATQKESEPSTPGFVAPLSTFRKNKAQQNKAQIKCTNCGSEGHNFKELSLQDRHEFKAFGKRCKCKKANNFAQVCCSRVLKEDKKMNIVENQSMAVLQSMQPCSNTGQKKKNMILIKPREDGNIWGI